MAISRVLIYGCGSIGLRHAQMASSHGAEVSCISSKDDLPFPSVKNISNLDCSKPFDLVVIATPTSLHAKHLEEISALPAKVVLLEKPLFSSMENLYNFQDSYMYQQAFVAYNLRFHPALNYIRALIQGKKILSMQLHVGQYLPSWRPEQDYTQNYSAYKTLGGGVLRDLSHELDLAHLFAGTWKRVTALGGKISNLDIQSEDCVSILAEHENCPQVTIHLDYLQTPARRDIVFVLENDSICFNLITNEVSSGDKIEKFVVDRNATYSAQMASFLKGDVKNACSYEQGLNVVKYIDAIENAIEAEKWIWNTDQ